MTSKLVETSVGQYLFSSFVFNVIGFFVWNGLMVSKFNFPPLSVIEWLGLQVVCQCLFKFSYRKIYKD